MNIAILVVTYNRKNLLYENISAIRKQSYIKYDYYICDNASTDGTHQIVAHAINKDKRIKYYNTGANLGGAGGFAYGLKIILKEKYDFCWVMDDDAIPDKAALWELVNAAEKIGYREFSFLASYVLWTDGTLCKMNQCSILNADTWENKECLDVLPIDRCSFVGCFINLYYAKKIGLPIKEFFIYGDDAEYTLRLSNCNKAFWIPKSKVIHKMPSNSRIGIAEAPLERISRYKYEYRNRVYIYRNRDKLSWGKIIYIYIKECVKVLIRSQNSKCIRLRVIIGGLIKGIRFSPEIEMVE